MTTDATGTAPPSAAERRAVARPAFAVAAVIVSAAIAPFLVGALSPLIGEDLTFDATDVGTSVAAYYLVSGTLSPLGGRIVHRLGVLLAMRLACGLTTVGVLAIAAAGSALHLIITLGLLGIPNSLVQPAANAVLASVRAPRLKALAFGVVQASIPTATLIAGVVLGLASVVGGWRVTVVAVAGFTLVALWMTRILPDPDRSLATARPSSTIPTVRPPGAAAALTALVAIGFLASAAATALPSFVASTGVAVGLAPAAVAVVQAVGSLACASTRIAAPLMVRGSAPVRQLVTIGVLLTLGAAGFLFLGTGAALGFAIGAVVAYAFGWGWNGLFNLLVVAIMPDRVAAATGMTQAGVFLGGLVGPLGFALALHHGGFNVAWLLASLWTLAAVVAAAVGVALLRRSFSSHPDLSKGTPR